MKGCFSLVGVSFPEILCKILWLPFLFLLFLLLILEGNDKEDDDSDQQAQEEPDCLQGEEVFIDYFSHTNHFHQL